jgi:hypothetical protein
MHINQEGKRKKERKKNKGVDTKMVARGRKQKVNLLQ